MKHQQLLILGCALLCSTVLMGQKYSNEFLSIGVSARAQAMGNAVVATTDDATAGYWNPAGMAFIGNDVGLQLSAMHAEWFAGIGKFDYVGLSVPLSNKGSRLGLSVVRFGIDNIPNTLSLYEDDGTINYDNIVAFSAVDFALLGSYGKQLELSGNGKLAVGGNIKIIRRTIGTFASSWGFGVDLSAQYRTKKWRFGFLGRDLTTTFNAWTFSFTEREREVLLITNNEVPISSNELTRPQLLLGAGYSFSAFGVTITPEFDLVATTDGKRNTLISAEPISIDPAFGLEVEYNDFIFLRAGINQFQQQSSLSRDTYWTSRPSIGVGLKMSNLNIDYAFTNLSSGDSSGSQINSNSTYSHIVSLLLSLEPKKKKSNTP